MSAATRDFSRYRPLIEELVAAFAAAGKAVLPAGRREEVIELLTQMVTEPDVYDAYMTELTAGRQRLGPEGKRRLLNASGPEVPWERIRKEGFDGLPDDVLADLATSPEALAVLDESQFRGRADIGAWFFDAILRERTGRADVAGVGAGVGATADLRRADEVEPSAPPSRPIRLARFAIPLAIAASLFLAFYLGTFWPRQDGRREVRLTSVAVRGDVTRGIDDIALDVTNGTDRRVFLTVVGLAPGRKIPAYYYRSEGRYVEVPAGGTAEVKNLPPEFEGSAVLLVVSTRVPAGGVVREVMPPAVTPGSAAADAEQLRKALADLGIDADVRVVALPATR